MYCKLVDISGHVYRHYFDRLIFKHGQITLLDVDGYPIVVVPVSDVKTLTIE